MRSLSEPRSRLHFGSPLCLLALVALLLIIVAACTNQGPSAPSPTTPGIRVIVVTATPRPNTIAESQTPAPTTAPSPVATVTTAPAPTVEPTATLAPQATATPTPPRSSNVVVVAPSSGQLVASPIRVQGMARAFEATIEVVVIADGKQIAHSGVRASAGAPDWGVFDATVEAEVPAGTEPIDGEVRVMIPSTKDGGDAEVVTIPVKIQPRGAQSGTPGTRVVKVYFWKTVDNQLTFVPVNRMIPWTLAVGRASLEELLEGPTAAESASGLHSNLPAGTKVLGLQIKNGVAYADFDRALQKGAQGSAAIYGMIQQVRLTLLQFSTVKQVVISVEGKTEGILEP